MMTMMGNWYASPVDVEYDDADKVGLQGSCEEEEVVIRLHERLLTLLRPYDHAYITN